MTFDNCERSGTNMNAVSRMRKTNLQRKKENAPHTIAVKKSLDGYNHKTKTTKVDWTYKSWLEMFIEGKTPELEITF
jgi:hypothetical protein